MQFSNSHLLGAIKFSPKLYADDRGSFLESSSTDWFHQAGVTPPVFVQDNQSHSKCNVLRGLHFQTGEFAQGKLCYVSLGTVFDVFVDIRLSSPTFGHWDSVELDDVSHQRVWIPPGFAHGFYVKSPIAIFHYKVTKPYAPGAENSIIWNDPFLSISWPLKNNEAPILSGKDLSANSFNSCFPNV